MPPIYPIGASKEPLPVFEPGHFDQLAIFHNMMHRAGQRCSELAVSEKLMGYEESCLAYCELKDEMRIAYAWLAETLP